MSTSDGRVGFDTPRRSAPAAAVEHPSVWSTARGSGAAYWIGTSLLSLLAAFVLVSVFREFPVAPGGDPGNWLATSLAYIGRPYPTQVVPLAYAPLSFPLLGAAVVYAGPLHGVDLFAGGLVFALGLSTAALAATLLRSRVVAFFAVAFLLFDPSILAMFFWGAYPNLLGFVFLNLALAGLLRAGQGHASSGAAQFWTFFSLAVLTHSLVAAVLGATASLYVLLGLFVPMPSWGTVLGRARRGELEAPGVASRALIGSRGGHAGIILFIGLVGGYYLGTWAAGIPHPNYLSSDATGFGLSTVGGALGAIFPGVTLPVGLVIAVLVGAALAAALLYGVLRDRHPEWLTAPAVLLIAWALAITVLILVGYAAKIVTDYHRFGFFYVIPAALALGYVIERAWVLRRPEAAAADGEEPDAFGPSGPARHRSPWTSIAPAHRRPAAFAAIALLVLTVVAATATAPALAKEETAFTQVGHDSMFLQAVHAIRSSGVSGGIITVPGADKWARGLTGENSYAPYATTALLFYPAQQYDSQLTYYALTSHYALTNGQVSVSVRGAAPGLDGGVPDYWIYQSGNLREILRLPPSYLEAQLVDPSTGQRSTQNVTASPTVTVPSSAANATGAMVVSFVQPAFYLNLSATIAPAQPWATIVLTATARAPYELTGLAAAVTPPAGSSALAWLNLVPGSFYWSPTGSGGAPITYGNVTPASALKGATDFDPSTGGPTALLDFPAAGNASRSLTGTLNLSTPVAATTAGGSPGAFNAPQIWGYLGVRFILWWNASATSAAAVEPATEAGYLEAEYGLPVIYQNAEWNLLEIPDSYVTTSGAALAPAPTGGSG